MDHIVQDGHQKISNNKVFGAGDNKVRLDYKKAIHSIRGPDVTIYDSSKYTNVVDAVRDALNNITERQGQRGVTILYNGWSNRDIGAMIKTVTEVRDKTPIYYLHDYAASVAGVKSATEEEMKMWLNDRGNRNLVTDHAMVAGWEDTTLIALHDRIVGRSNIDNLCLRCVSSLHLIKYRDIKYKKSDDDCT